MQAQDKPLAIRPELLVIAALVLPRLLLMAVLPLSALSHDIYAWTQVAEVLARGGNPYAETHLINYPPFWLQLIFLFTQLDLRFGIGFLLQIRLLLILCECVTACLLLVLARKHLRVRNATVWILGGLSLNPICILLTVQHGNFDALVGVWILLFVWCLLDHHRDNEVRPSDSWLLACLFLGLGILTKTVPFVLTPLLFYRSKQLSRTTRLIGMSLVFGPVALGMSVIFALAPGPVFRHVIAYRSIPGNFGISGLLRIAGLDSLNLLYPPLFTLVLLAALVLLAIILYRLDADLSPHDVLLLCSLILVGIPLLGPGYSPQYVCWYLPMLILLAVRPDFGWRPALLVLFGVGSLTYLVEYSLIQSHGAFLIRGFGCQALEPMGAALSSPAVQTLTRLPLFAAYGVFFARGCAVLRRHIAPKPEPQVQAI